MQESVQKNGEKSQKSYAVAVCLVGVFGILGVHHFYVGRWGMGLLDVFLSVAGFGLLIAGSPFGFLFLFIDVVHTVVVIYLLLVGEYKDGAGKRVAYPGQKL